MVTKNSGIKDNRPYLKPLIYVLLIIAGIFIGMELTDPATSKISRKDLNKEKDLSIIKIDQLYQYLENRYVDTIQFRDLTDAAITDALKALDPHSYYVSTSEVKDFNDRLNGYYFGLGFETIQLDGRLFVTNVYPEAPASQADLNSGDEILHVDGIVIEGNSAEAIDAIQEKFKSYRNREIVIKVHKYDSKELLDLTIGKSRIEVPSVDAYFMLDEKTGFIRLKRFSMETYREFMAAIEDMVKNEAMENLVIDVRGNPGGYLKQVVDILSQLYQEEDIVLVSTEGVNSKKIEYKSTGKSFYPIGKVAVLIDGSSASGSEVLAGAIQDTDRGIIIGTSSFGKGLVQERYELIDGSEIRLTTSRYFTPSGRSIQKKYPSQTAEFVDSSDSYNSSNGRSLESHCGVVPDIATRDSLWTEKIENRFLKCWLVESRMETIDEANIQDYLSTCMSLPEDKFSQETLKKRIQIATSDTQSAWEDITGYDEAVRLALQYINSDDLFETVLNN